MTGASDGTTLCYAAAAANADSAAGFFAALDVKPGDPVAVMLPNGLDFVLVWLGLFRLGALMVALNHELKGVPCAPTGRRSVPRGGRGHHDDTAHEGHRRRPRAVPLRATGGLARGSAMGREDAGGVRPLRAIVRPLAGPPARDLVAVLLAADERQHRSSL